MANPMNHYSYYCPRKKQAELILGFFISPLIPLTPNKWGVVSAEPLIDENDVFTTHYQWSVSFVFFCDIS